MLIFLETNTINMRNRAAGEASNSCGYNGMHQRNVLFTLKCVCESFKLATSKWKLKNKQVRVFGDRASASELKENLTWNHSKSVLAYFRLPFNCQINTRVKSSLQSKNRFPAASLKVSLNLLLTDIYKPIDKLRKTNPTFFLSQIYYKRG